MPKFPKAFGRRKSGGNAFEDAPEGTVVEPSFKVFERPDGGRDAGSRSFDGGVKLTKATTTIPAGRPKTSHVDEDNLFANIGKNR